MSKRGHGRRRSLQFESYERLCNVRPGRLLGTATRLYQPALSLTLGDMPRALVSWPAEASHPRLCRVQQRKSSHPTRTPSHTTGRHDPSHGGFRQGSVSHDGWPSGPARVRRTTQRASPAWPVGYWSCATTLCPTKPARGIAARHAIPDQESDHRADVLAAFGLTQRNLRRSHPSRSRNVLSHRAWRSYVTQPVTKPFTCSTIRSREQSPRCDG